MEDEKKTAHIDVAYVAELARLALSEEEIATFTPQLEQVIGYVDLLAELDTEGIEPTAHAHPVENVFRADAERSSLPREAILDNAPAQLQQQISVPKIIEGL